MYTIVLTGSFDSRHSIVPGNDGQLRIRISECKLFYRFVIKLCCITRPHFPFYYFESLLRHASAYTSDILEAHFEKAVGLALTLSSGEIEVAGSENTTQDSIYAVEELRSAISKLVRIPQQTYGGASKSALASFDDKEAGYEEVKVDINTILKQLLERRSIDTL